jgi:hypothetical protein
VLVMKVVQVGAVFQLGFQARGFKLGCSSPGVQVGVLWISWFPFVDGVETPNHVKVNPLGEVSIFLIMART